MRQTAFFDKPFLVVIPWRAASAQGTELKYAVEGWKRHCLDQHTIVVVGEDDPKMEDVNFIYSKRVDDIPGQYRQHLDYVSCFKKVHAAYPESWGFVFVADDVYAVNDFGMSDVAVLKRFGGDVEYRIDSANAWRRDKAKTKALLLSMGYPCVNYTTHLPQWYDWDLLEALWENYDMEHESYVMEDLYFNMFFSNRLSVNVFDTDDNEQPFLRGVYRPDPRVEKIEEALKNRIWINNAKEGWCPALDRILYKHYFGDDTH